jgi:D-alanine transaminase
MEADVALALADLNGERMPVTEAKIPALDRGFLLGDAVYEVIRIYHGRPWLMDEHLRRLSHSLEGIRIRGVDLPALEQRIRQTIAAGPFLEATVYVQVTRGVAGRSHAFPATVRPLEFFYVQDFEDPYPQARQAGTSVITHPDLRWGRCDIKSTNLLAAVLAKQEAREAGAWEALFMAPDGVVREGGSSNVFAVLGGVLRTHPLDRHILGGITRMHVLEIARRLAIPSDERAFTLDEILESAGDCEFFSASTTTDILPVAAVGGTAIRGGKPGPVTLRLLDEMRATMAEMVGQERPRALLAPVRH